MFVLYVALFPLSEFSMLLGMFSLLLLSVGVDYWAYRAVNRLFLRLLDRRQAVHAERATNEPDSSDPASLGDRSGIPLTPGTKLSLEQLVDELSEGLNRGEGTSLSGARNDLYRLRGLNNQLIKLSEMAQELNAALPYRETKTRALESCRQLLSADLVALVSEHGREFSLEGVAGGEESEVNLSCCSYYSSCSVRTAFREVEQTRASGGQCGCFPPSMRARLALPFRTDDERIFALLAAAAHPQSFDNLNDVVINTLVSHVQTALSTALKYDTIRREVATDPLTNLYNRRFFEKRAEEEIERSLRHQQPVTLLMLDVDHFKSVNDTYGHQTGDKVLQAVAGFLAGGVRKSDICGRYGGEEFVLLLPATPGRNAMFLADRLRTGLSEVMYTGLGLPSDRNVTVSGGLATCPRDGISLEELIARADEALYEAKRRGRNQIVRAAIAGTPDATPTGQVRTSSEPCR
jgi:diguanylate cyclase (GGDEF)-like protein